MRIYSTFSAIFALLLSFMVQATEKEFWEVKAKLEQDMLVSEKAALDLINDLEYKINHAKRTGLMLSALFEAQLDFIELYGSKQELKNHIEKNISKINTSHNYYNVYLSKLAIMYFEFGEQSKYQDVIRRIELNGGQLFAAVAELTTSANETNFQLVNSFCHDCNFYLYHNAIANYYSELGLYSILEKFVQETLSKNYIVEGREDIRSSIFLAYFYIANKCQNIDSEHLEEIRMTAVAETDHLKGLSIRVKSILNSGCR
jgi:hypothetical protein